MDVRTSSRFRRERAAVPSARTFVGHALARAAPPAEIVEALVLATAEACNNAILHAGGSMFTVGVAVEPGRAMVCVTDDGDGFVPPERAVMPAPDHIGRRGLALMEALVDRVEVSSGAEGTTVVLVQSFVPEGSTSLAAGA